MRAVVSWGPEVKDWEQAVRAVQGLDLVINVLKGGGNGIYGAVEVEVS